MSLKTAYENLATLLTGDADITALLGELTVIKGNQDVGRIRPNELPALVLELGPADLQTQVSGRVAQGRDEMRAAIVWHEQDNATAFGQRLALVPLVTQALLSDQSLSGAVDGAEVTQVKPDLGMNHPRHAVQFIVGADITIKRG